MFHSVILASMGRAEVLDDTVASVLDQTRPPDEVILAVPSPEDVLPRTTRRPRVRVVLPPRGLTAQRNFALRHVHPEAEIVSFLDDDVELAADYLERAGRLFRDRADVVLFWGYVVDDGNKKGGIPRSVAKQLTATWRPREGRFSRASDAYGCNMNVRRAVADRVRFDERMPLYGWLEDRDFGARCAREGLIGTFDGCALVHLAVPGGRTSGYRYGYSQVVNPIYLGRKRSMSSAEVVLFVGRALVRNGVGAAAFDRRIDRWGRFRGNLLGLAHVVRGRIQPELILQLG